MADNYSIGQVRKVESIILMLLRTIVFEELNDLMLKILNFLSEFFLQNYLSFTSLPQRETRS